jgi:hypothetical protein
MGLTSAAAKQYKQDWTVVLSVRESLGDVAPGGMWEVVRAYEASGQVGFSVPICAMLRRDHAVDVALFLSGQEGVPCRIADEAPLAGPTGYDQQKYLYEVQAKLAGAALGGALR